MQSADRHDAADGSGGDGSRDTMRSHVDRNSANGAGRGRVDRDVNGSNNTVAASVSGSDVETDAQASITLHPPERISAQVASGSGTEDPAS
eukprot:40239-Eustigmatos_ZCMA.PRE.1